MAVQPGIPALRPVLTNYQGAAPDPRPPELPRHYWTALAAKQRTMRLSVTDKFNLRCTYCMPAEGLHWLPKQAVVTAAEIEIIVGLGVERLGVRELRITGGEPSARTDLVDIIATLRQRHPRLQQQGLRMGPGPGRVGDQAARHRPVQRSRRARPRPPDGPAGALHWVPRPGLKQNVAVFSCRPVWSGTKNATRHFAGWRFSVCCCSAGHGRRPGVLVPGVVPVLVA